jgi:hypothetical protein
VITHLTFRSPVPAIKKEGIKDSCQIRRSVPIQRVAVSLLMERRSVALIVKALRDLQKLRVSVVTPVVAERLLRLSCNGLAG